jgi:hypothetical protein
VRDFIEYIKKVLSLQLNVTKMSQEERLFIKEKGFAQGKVEAVLFQKIEGLDVSDRSYNLFLEGTIRCAFSQKYS